MPDTDQQRWWRDLLRKDVLAGHVVGTLVGIAVTFVVGLAVTLFWIAWAAWRGSFIWTQRMIGASMAFAVAILITAVALALLRRRLIVSSADSPAASKGYLDHQVDSAKASAVITREMNNITMITEKETQQIKAGTARIGQISRLPYEKRLTKELVESRRSARLTDKTTRKLAARIPSLAGAIETYSRAELAYWRWYTANYQMNAQGALGLLNSKAEHLVSIQGYLQALEEGKTATAGRRGASQVLNEAIERRLNVIDRLRAAMALQEGPLQEVVALLEPFTKSQDA